MDKIRIKNLRALNDTGNISIKPLTILLGKNSIGKSTFLRTFPLFKQSLRLKRSEPILWYSPQLVDFGSFKDSISDNKTNNTIDFEFLFKVHQKDIKKSLLFSRFTFKRNFRPIDKEEEISLKVCFDSKEISRVEIQIFDYSISFNSTNANISNLIINNMEVKNVDFHFIKNTYLNEELIPQLIYKNEKENYLSRRKSFSKYIETKLYDEIKKIKNGRIGEKKIKDIIENLPLNTREVFVKEFEELISSSKIMTEKYEKLESEKKSELLDNLYNINGCFYLNSFLNIVNSYLDDYFKNSQYIAPIRASAERYYRIQGLSVDEIAPQGENIPMILRNLSKVEQENWEKWTRENFGVEFKVREKESNISINLVKNEKEINLADTGFGYSQLLPLLVYCWRLVQKSNKRKRNFLSRSQPIQTLIIEQPELHLHPALQSQLLEVFVELLYLMNKECKFSIIIETHSETLINYLGYLIAKKESKIKSDEVNILLFEESENKTNIREVSYSEEGYLNNWPYDFFIPKGREN